MTTYLAGAIAAAGRAVTPGGRRPARPVVAGCAAAERRCPARDAAIRPATGPGAGQAAGLPAHRPDGPTPWTELVTNTSLAACSRALVIGITLTPRPVAAGEPQDGGPGDAGQQPSVRGRGVQHPADDREHVGPVGLQHLARRCPRSAGARRAAGPRQRAHVRRAAAGRATCARPRPPGMTTGTQVSLAGGRSSGTTSTRGVQRPAGWPHGDPQPPRRVPGEQSGQVAGEPAAAPCRTAAGRWPPAGPDAPPAGRCRPSGPAAR